MDRSMIRTPITLNEKIIRGFQVERHFDDVNCTDITTYGMTVKEFIKKDTSLDEFINDFIRIVHTINLIMRITHANAYVRRTLLALDKDHSNPANDCKSLIQKYVILRQFCVCNNNRSGCPNVAQFVFDSMQPDRLLSVSSKLSDSSKWICDGKPCAITLGENFRIIYMISTRDTEAADPTKVLQTTYKEMWIGEIIAAMVSVAIIYNKFADFKIQLSATQDFVVSLDKNDNAFVNTVIEAILYWTKTLNETLQTKAEMNIQAHDCEEYVPHNLTEIDIGLQIIASLETNELLIDADSLVNNMFAAMLNNQLFSAIVTKLLVFLMEMSIDQKKLLVIFALHDCSQPERVAIMHELLLSCDIDLRMIVIPGKLISVENFEIAQTTKTIFDKVQDIIEIFKAFDAACQFLLIRGLYSMIGSKTLSEQTHYPVVNETCCQDAVVNETCCQDAL